MDKKHEINESDIQNESTLHSLITYFRGRPQFREVANDLMVAGRPLFDQIQAKHNAEGESFSRETFRAYLLKNYDAGGHWLYETRSDEELALEFSNKKEMKDYCELMVEQGLNTRNGDDDDRQLKDYENFKANWIN